MDCEKRPADRLPLIRFRNYCLLDERLKMKVRPTRLALHLNREIQAITKDLSTSIKASTAQVKLSKQHANLSRIQLINLAICSRNSLIRKQVLKAFNGKG